MRLWLATLLVALASQLAMAEDIFLESQSPVSKRYAVLEDNGKIAFLYLTAPGIPKPMKDAVVCIRVPPVEAIDWERIKKSGETPLLRKDLPVQLRSSRIRKLRSSSSNGLPMATLWRCYAMGSLWPLQQ